ncbi:unnamed protein product, partial [Ranitomeya imitator]
MTALRNLETDTSLVLKPSDKGGNVVVMDIDKYRDLCLSLLNDCTTYIRVTSNPVGECVKTLGVILTKAKDDMLISEEELSFLLPRHPVMATFYALPKVHKGLDPLRGRPIVSGIGSVGQNVGIYLDDVLRPFVVSLPSYIRDTMDLLRKLEGISLEPGTLLASIDVEALYSSIPHEHGIGGVRHFINTRGCQFNAHNKLILTLLEFVLSNNYFTFDGRTFHQLRGTAMGNPCAPTNPQVVKDVKNRVSVPGWWEDCIVFSEVHAQYLAHIDLWVRYIDDIFVIWRGSKDVFNLFIESLNNNGVGLKFTYDIQEFQLPFLDVLISKSQDGEHLESTIYRKPTATNSLLRWDSNHPYSLKKGIPKGQYLRLRRNCSNQRDFKVMADDLRQRFLARGYPDRILREAFRYANQQERGNLLIPKREETEPSGTTRIICTYDNGAASVKNIIRKHWDILRMDEDLRDTLGTEPVITYRRARTLGDRLVHSHFTTPRGTTWLPQRPAGCFRCGGCIACDSINTGKEFYNENTQETFKLKKIVNCKSTGVVYRTMCQCGITYVCLQENGAGKRGLRRRRFRQQESAPAQSALSGAIFLKTHLQWSRSVSLQENGAGKRGLRRRRFRQQESAPAQSAPSGAGSRGAGRRSRKQRWNRE